MKKIPFVPLKGVDNIELFYDLIFVYCISVLTSLLHHPHNGFIDWSVYGVFLVSFLIVLQIWMYTTLLMNRYGTKSLGDYTCLLLNMFFLYFMASGIGEGWENGALRFNISWACILLNLIVHWYSKLMRFDGLDKDDRLIIIRSIEILALQLILVIVSLFVHSGASGWMSVIALLVGYILFFQGGVYRRKPSRFSHITERCVLIVIVTFGEMVVALTAFTTGELPLGYPVLTFLLMVGLFLIYDYEYDNMLDHHCETDGMAYLALNSWIVIIIDSITLGMEFLVTDGFNPAPSSAFLATALVLYLLTSFLLARYNKPTYSVSLGYIAGRVVGCIAIVAVSLTAWQTPLVCLLWDTLVVYGVLLHEMFLYRGRTAVVNRASELGYSQEDMEEAGYTFETSEGRRAIRRAVNKVSKRKQDD